MERFEIAAWAPGRTEIAGNHVDHQGGRVIAAAIDLGVEIRLKRDGGGEAILRGGGLGDARVALDDLAPREGEAGTTQALVRGVLAGCAAAGVRLAGFRAESRGTVPAGGGLSSSAAFELALATAVCKLGGASLGTSTLARIGQEAERDFFGKPCGLMDQMASACGGVALMDFEDADAPAVERIECDLADMGLAVCIIDVGADHSSLSGSYASIPDDMRAAARLVGAERLRDVEEKDLLENLGRVREGAGDLAALRALHYFNEMRLVDERAEALQSGDARAFLQATRRSAASSAQYLQNIDAPGDARPTAMALALADSFLGARGAARIHGGGFGGSIQAFVPLDELEAFSTFMDARLGAGSCMPVEIGCEGARIR